MSRLEVQAMRTNVIEIFCWGRAAGFGADWLILAVADACRMDAEGRH